MAALRAKALKDRLSKIEAEAREIKAKARAEIIPIRLQLVALGPRPGEGALPEAKEIVVQRERIAKELAVHETRIKQADLTIAVAVPDFLRLLAQLGRSPFDWWDWLDLAQKERVVFTRFALVVLLALVFGWGLRRALLRRLGRDPTIEAPSYSRRLTGAIAEGVAHGLIPSLILAGLLLRALSEDALISGLFAWVFIHFCAVAILFVLARALPRAVLAPELPAWRLVPVARDNARTLRSKAVQAAFAIPHKARERYKFWLRALLDLTVLLGGFVMVLIVWGVAPRDIWAGAGKTWRGATIGSVTISLGDILVAIVVFVVVLTLTRMIRRLLNERIFPQTGLDTGVRNSLSTGLSYAGLAIALALAVTTIGFDLSNLAIIAGALSVGIGFGLQNVVNNFVSGLILLVERPIKVGDWIEVGVHEGYVRRISVRATEIETFRRAAVIVPNSELISGAVINWTHKNRYGRVELPVGVAYGSDVAQVMDILRRCLEANESILRMPEPYVLFTGFGDSSLDFEARGQISNVEYLISVQSDLRIAIYLAFEEAGIEIPFPQRDLHIKNVEKIDEGFRARVARPTPQAPATARVRTDPGWDGE